MTGRGTFTGSKPRCPHGRVFHVPPSSSGKVAMRARTNPPPCAALPVEHVVLATSLGGARPIGQLVPTEPGGLQHLVRNDVLVRDIVIVGAWELSAPDPGGEPGAVFDDECVRG